MNKYFIEVDSQLNKLLEENSQVLNVSIEKFISDILSRFVASPHILDNEDVKNGYEACGELNLQLSR